MDKKQKLLLILVVLAFLISIGITFYKTIILRDFEIVNVEEEAAEGEMEESQEVEY